MDKWIKILEIMKKYCNEFNEAYPFWAEHDIIGLNLNLEQIFEEDIKQLDELGVFYSDEYDSLIKFV